VTDWTHADLDDITARYITGETIDAIDADYAVTAHAIRNRFHTARQPPRAGPQRDQRHAQLVVPSHQLTLRSEAPD